MEDGTERPGGLARAVTNIGASRPRAPPVMPSCPGEEHPVLRLNGGLGQDLVSSASLGLLHEDSPVPTARSVLGSPSTPPCPNVTSGRPVPPSLCPTPVGKQGTWITTRPLQ